MILHLYYSLINGTILVYVQDHIEKGGFRFLEKLKWNFNPFVSVLNMKT